MEAQQLIEAARREADAMRSATRAECERAMLEARKRGEQAGFAVATQTVLNATAKQRAQAVAAATAEASAKNSAYTETLKKLLAQRSAILESAESELVKLAIGIAEQILGEYPIHDPAYIVRLAHRALEQLATAGRVRVRCSTQEHGILMQHRSEFDYDAGDLEFICDPELIPGSIIVECADGRSADASINSQMALVRKRLHATSRAELPDHLPRAS